MDHVEQTLSQLLREHGHSLTRTRVRVLKTLLGQEPMYMYELVDRARGVDRASVYRTVELFEQLGIVQRLNIGWKYKLELTDKFADHHHHLTCTNCDRSIDLNEHELERAIDKLALGHGFAPSAHQIEIQGLCADCQTRQAAD